MRGSRIISMTRGLQHLRRALRRRRSRMTSSQTLIRQRTSVPARSWPGWCNG